METAGSQLSIVTAEEIVLTDQLGKNQRIQKVLICSKSKLLLDFSESEPEIQKTWLNPSTKRTEELTSSETSRDPSSTLLREDWLQQLLKK